MARYFAGNSLAAFARTNSAIVEATTAGKFDSTYVASAINIPASSPDYAEGSAFSATGTLHWVLEINPGGGANGNGPTLMNSTTGVFRIIGSSGTTCQCQYWNGSAWTNTGSTFTLTTGTLYRCYVKIVLASSFELYLGGSLITSGSSWSGGGTTVTNVRLYSMNTNSGGTYYSQVMLADYDLRDSHYMPRTLTGNSATNTGSFSGSYTDINETVLDESTALNVATVGNKAGQTKAAITLATGYRISAMVINARGKVSGGIVTDGKFGIRSAGTNYSSSGRGFNSSYEPRTYLSDTDPATGAAFTTASFNAAEIYEEAA